MTQAKRSGTIPEPRCMPIWLSIVPPKRRTPPCIVNQVASKSIHTDFRHPRKCTWIFMIYCALTDVRLTQSMPCHFAQDCKQRLVDPFTWLQSNEALSRADEPKRTRNLLSSAHNALVNEPGCIWPHSRDDRWSTSIRAQQAYRPNHWPK